MSLAIVQKLSRDIELFKKLLLIPEGTSVSDHVQGLLQDAGEDQLNDAIESIGLRIARDEYQKVEQFDVKVRSALLRMWLVLREDKVQQLKLFQREHGERMGFNEKATFITQHMDLKIVSSALGYAYQSVVIGAEIKARQKIIDRGDKIPSESEIGHEFFINLLFTFDESKANQLLKSLNDKFSAVLWGRIEGYSARPVERKRIERQIIKNQTRISGNGEEYNCFDRITDSRAVLPEDEAIDREEREEREDKLRKITKALELYVDAAKTDKNRDSRQKHVEVFRAFWGLGDDVREKFGTIESIAQASGCSESEAQAKLRKIIAKFFKIYPKQVGKMKQNVEDFIKRMVQSKGGVATEDKIDETFEEAGNYQAIADALTDFIKAGNNTDMNNRVTYVEMYLLSTKLPIRLTQFGGNHKAIVVPEEEVNNKKRLEAEAIAEETGIRVRHIQRAVNKIARHINRYQENLTKSQDSLIADPDASPH